MKRKTGAPESTPVISSQPRRKDSYFYANCKTKCLTINCFGNE